ncbi:hypothetical protein SESBI_41735 [Sesbania bispinosa]|nr:hypothetical protein SESBI_41735 [Sesbania bispinosa]
MKEVGKRVPLQFLSINSTKSSGVSHALPLLASSGSVSNTPHMQQIPVSLHSLSKDNKALSLSASPHALPPLQNIIFLFFFAPLLAELEALSSEPFPHLLFHLQKDSTGNMLEHI